jgi:hypothetical protein
VLKLRGFSPQANYRRVVCRISTDVLEDHVASMFRIEEQDLLAICFMLVSFLVYSSTLKTEATSSFETWVDFQ